MQEQKTCRLCVFAWLALILVTAGLFAMPFLPCSSLDTASYDEAYEPTIVVTTAIVDPATIGSLDRAEMPYPED